MYIHTKGESTESWRLQVVPHVTRSVRRDAAYVRRFPFPLDSQPYAEFTTRNAHVGHLFFSLASRGLWLLSQSPSWSNEQTTKTTDRPNDRMADKMRFMVRFMTTRPGGISHSLFSLPDKELALFVKDSLRDPDFISYHQFTKFVQFRKMCEHKDATFILY